MINQSSVDQSLFNFLDEGLFTELSSTLLGGTNEEFIEENLLHLPPLYNRYHPSFVALSHLYNIYLESYLCIAYGLYSAGIIVIGQLFELTLKEIIRVHTGKYLERGELGLALIIVKGEEKNNPKPFLVHPVITEQIDGFKNHLRNPYTHVDRKKLIGKKTVKGLLFEVKTGPGEILKSVENAKTEFSKNSENLIDFPIAEDPIIAEIYKKQFSERDAITTAWKMYPLFSLLVDLYLTPEQYQESIKKYGSIYSSFETHKFEE